MTDKEKLKKIKDFADAMYYAAQYLTTDASRLHKAMDEYHKFIIHEYHKEEPVSKDLEEAAKNYMRSQNPPIWGLYHGFKAGAQWQKQQMTKEPISEDWEKAAKHYLYSNILYDDVYVGNPTDKDCIEMFKAGAKWQIAKLMANATEVTVHIDAGNYPYIPQIELYDYDKDIPLVREGDKYKVVFIKEE